ncbi:hypothetical protein UFOVP558_48 [uncultured Caudovirales phage]|uniref:Uncharacterized protein n=1 Tax=uncultured Caudovirales phage TaxID=2100421 RepID=A0A6J5MVB1_9CAUD|nr:hypothetical protein UFOVP558_48 [uncultured Caudovirales phage]
MRTDPNGSVYVVANQVGEVRQDFPGLTKRELFTLEAMKARLLNVSMYDRHGCQYEAVAHDAVKWADAAIAELNKPDQPPKLEVVE